MVVNPLHRPVWRYTPRPDRLAEYYPEDALERGREGEASLHCIIQKKGALNCEPVSESPARAGFGTAALRVSRTLRHADQLANGKDAIGTPINLHVVFRMAEGERRSSRG
ncbi:MAG: TonB family protein [Alphaproteobacteria bacterium]